MNRIAKFVAPLALFAAFGAAQAGEVAYGDIKHKPVMGGSAAMSAEKVVGAPSGEKAFGQPGTVAQSGTQSPARMAGERIEQPLVIGA